MNSEEIDAILVKMRDFESAVFPARKYMDRLDKNDLDFAFITIEKILRNVKEFIKNKIIKKMNA